MLKRLACAMILTTCTAAQGADLTPPQPKPADAWDVRIQPYLWATSLDATVRPAPNVPPTDVDARFRDILENLKFAGMVAGSARRGRFGVSGDLQYVALQVGEGLPGVQFNRARVTTQLFIGTALADYHPIIDPRGELTVSAGIRLYNSDTKVELLRNVGPNVEGSGADFWADPMVGVRGRFDVTPNVFVSGWAYAGGFGLGSDFASDLFGGAGYSFTDHISVNVGYRFLSVDRDTSDFEFDARMHGPFAGLIVSF